jgi:hypothetical protein
MVHCDCCTFRQTPTQPTNKSTAKTQPTPAREQANMALSFITPALLAAVVFIPYSQVEGKSLSAAVVFSTMAYFIAVRARPFAHPFARPLARPFTHPFAHPCTAHSFAHACTTHFFAHPCTTHFFAHPCTTHFFAHAYPCTAHSFRPILTRGSCTTRTCAQLKTRDVT